MEFMDALKNELLENFNVSVTENGAVGYRTTGKGLLDLNFAVASLRRASEEEIVEKFKAAYFEDKTLAVKWLFFARDVRGGLGERRLFRAIMKYISDYDPEIAKKVIPLISEYGRYDDLLCLLDCEKVRDDVLKVICDQLNADLEAYKNNKSISLLAKWLPSVNASSKTTKRYAKMIREAFGLHEREYRKILAGFRKYLDIVETKMSSREWSAIKYEAVPSRANVIYNSAFLRNDEKRRREFLSKLEKGETKINASVLYPHDIVHKYGIGDIWRIVVNAYDPALEAMWKALPDTVNGDGGTIVVADGSGSMFSSIGNSGVLAIEVANALAIYFAERLSGQFKNKYITFSEHPQYVQFGGAMSLRDKLSVAYRFNEVANTNIEAVFDLILSTAVTYRMPQKEIPANILIISDMEFDCCAGSNSRRFGVEPNLFKVIERKWAAYGYKLPRLVFWNVNSRTGTIPVRENDMGVALVSGFSVNVAKMVMSGKTDPFECLLETLNSERYKPVEDAVKGA